MSDRPKLMSFQIPGAFTAPVKRARVSPFYRLGLLLVAGAMLLLPLVYLGLIGAVAYGICHHITKNLEIRHRLSFR